MAVNYEAIIQCHKALCARGKHIYKKKWEAATSETLLCREEQGNSHSKTPWLLKRMGKLLDACHEKCFLKRDESIPCTATIAAVQFFIRLLFDVLKFSWV